MRRRQVVTLGVLAVLGVSPAWTETVLTPFAGVAFGGATEKSHGSYGGSLAFFGQTTGFEVDLGITPSIFGDGVSGEFFTTNDIVTLTGNLLVVAPAGDLRVYAAAGAGIMKTRLRHSDELFDVSSTDVGFDVGGGLIAYIGQTVGLRVDLRYFRSFSDLDAEADRTLDLGTVDYWRAVGGISLRF